MENAEHRCICGAAIDEDRYDAGFKTCILHGSQRPHVGFMSYAHKTAPDIVIIPNTSGSQETIRIARRAYERGR